MHGIPKMVGHLREKWNLGWGGGGTYPVGEYSFEEQETDEIDASVDEGEATSEDYMQRHWKRSYW
jgi:hypothetical protein